MGRVDDDVARESAVEIGRDAEVEIGFWPGDGGAEVVVGLPYLDDGGVVAVDGEGRRGRGWRCGGQILRNGFWKVCTLCRAWLSHGRGLG